MTPKEILQEWIDCFNAADAVALANLYAQDAINHQVANTPVIGKTAIHKMFVNEFATSKMVCIVEHIFEDGEWAIMEWEIRSGCEDADSSMCKTIKSFSKEVIGISSAFSNSTV